MLNDKVKNGFRRSVHPVIRLFAAMHITPNMLTLTGVLINILAAYTIAIGRFLTGGIILIVASIFDTFDGELARTTGKITSSGAFLDSISDRYSEFFILGGIGYHFIVTGNNIGIYSTFFAMIGSIMTSYTRARAEGVGIELKGGFFQRPERVLYLVIIILFFSKFLNYGMLLFALLTIFTALQRLIVGFNKIKSIKS
ncbi:CDP-alcohol phosphatidyltransferase family protein [candidate division WOR-3 bacterium]|uniref:CDP-alcohol phosphatidyltransferase family protein n=1 Tax=candidate division TA06 bacterium TaxID=2250710 RepID=A0A660S793_UNCT6|nr:CDP-alcohol phosphatidyltransferase family protein [candidate division WOR-3 bacterium]RKX65837.1 MAG: CDP-alcohol phosphatidyltransferase family protein [candidate division TA06 bacterium]HHD82639.1 CDP-alcohol phosphatidyltransferase family protein [Bacteroidota bacterium]